MYYRILIIASIGLFTDGYFLYIASATEPILKDIFSLTSFQIGILQSISPIGAVLGALICGNLTDKFGRKNMLLIDSTLFILSSVILFFLKNFLGIVFARLIIGAAVGVGYPTYAAYLSECTPKVEHGKIVAISMFLNVLALPTASIVGYLFYSALGNDSLRYIFLSGIVPSILCIICRHGLPESLSWQHAVSRSKKKNFMERYACIFSKQYLHYTIIFSLCWLIMDISYYGISLFTTNIIMAFNSTIVGKETLDLASLYQTCIINVFAAVGAIAAISCIKKYNNVFLQKWGFYVSGAALIALCFYGKFFTRPFELIFFFAIYNIAINLGPNVTTYLFPAEAYPPEIKATGHGFSAGMAKLGAFLGTLFLPILQSFTSIHIVLAILGGTLIFGGLLTNYINKNESEGCLEEGDANLA